LGCKPQVCHPIRQAQIRNNQAFTDRMRKKVVKAGQVRSWNGVMYYIRSSCMRCYRPVSSWQTRFVIFCETPISRPFEFRKTCTAPVADPACSREYCDDLGRPRENACRRASFGAPSVKCRARKLGLQMRRRTAIACMNAQRKIRHGPVEL
jgi:hypothetical protein